MRARQLPGEISNGSSQGHSTRRQAHRQLRARNPVLSLFHNLTGTITALLTACSWHVFPHRPNCYIDIQHRYITAPCRPACLRRPSYLLTQAVRLCPTPVSVSFCAVLCRQRQRQRHRAVLCRAYIRAGNVGGGGGWCEAPFTFSQKKYRNCIFMHIYAYVSGAGHV